MAGKGQKGALASSKKKTRGSFSFAGGMQVWQLLASAPTHSGDLSMLQRPRPLSSI